ncbi:hypothetical protein ECG_06779 [Echinococcus granulosus]|uniref:Uncharacterized protein n=1 Tax=Echinococcus granulosus TaxID=6210 RepID=A0A068WG89_ECHGR|nr:hypothetical protein ECG_06779 [Echinococcus granulosus]CDS19129.1 hypothetical protein EgrG_000441400 [Echinococcus granulosus]
MTKESIDSGLSSEQSQTSTSNCPPQQSLLSLRQYPLTAQASRHSQLLSPSAERNRTQLYAVVNPKDYRMSTGGGINPNNNNGQNTPSSTTAVATTLFPRCPSQIQQAPPRVHFRDTKGRPRFRHPSESTSVRAPPPFVRSFSSKAFEISDGLPPPPSVPRPSSPQHELAYRHRDTLLDKGIQCEPEAGITQQTKTHSNPLLSALLAAANATVNCPLGSSELDPALRRKPQFRAGTLPYWSDSEVNAYDSLDAFNAAPQNCLGMVGGSKAYPSASVVAAAATAAAMALAAVQSTSRGPTAKSLEPPMGTPMSRASLHLEDLTSEAAIMRSLTGQFADTSLYPRFPTSVDQRKSVNFDATSLQKPDIYGNAGVDITHFTSQAPPSTSLLDTNNQRVNIGPHYCKFVARMWNDIIIAYPKSFLICNCSLCALQDFRDY